jgi:hypothetical protein
MGKRNQTRTRKKGGVDLTGVTDSITRGFKKTVSAIAPDVFAELAPSFIGVPIEYIQEPYYGITDPEFPRFLELYVLFVPESMRTNMINRESNTNKLINQTGGQVSDSQSEEVFGPVDELKFDICLGLNTQKDITDNYNNVIKPKKIDIAEFMRLMIKFYPIIYRRSIALFDIWLKNRDYLGNFGKDYLNTSDKFKLNMTRLSYNNGNIIASNNSNKTIVDRKILNEINLNLRYVYSVYKYMGLIPKKFAGGKSRRYSKSKSKTRKYRK